MSISFGFLSTYPPTRCGLATFTASLIRNLTTTGNGDRAGVVRVVDAPVGSQAPEVIGLLQAHAHGSHRGAAEMLNTFDLAVIQHEYGIFGGTDGDQLLSVLDELRVPAVVIVHTVPASPTLSQRHLVDRMADACASVVAMTEVGRARLVADYGLDPAKVVVIPQGATRRGGGDGAAPGRRPLILTWGLMRPGRGIEWAIDGLQRLRDLRPRPAYIVAGMTHPRVLHQQGETYRLHLAERSRAVGVSACVRFAAEYLDESALNQLIRRADIVLLPYDSRDQVTSGVLVEALAAGKPVVATTFPHAVEVLASGAGLLVPQQDGPAIGDALLRVLTDPDLARRMASEAHRLAPTLLWSAVAAQYRALAAELLENRSPVPN